jgi:hypothetical protein
MSTPDWEHILSPTAIIRPDEEITPPVEGVPGNGAYLNVPIPHPVLHERCSKQDEITGLWCDRKKYHNDVRHSNTGPSFSHVWTG